MTGSVRPGWPAAVRHLPIRTPPVAGESFASYVDRLAHDTGAPLTAMLLALGMIDTEHDRAIGPGYGIALSPERRALFAKAADLPEERVARTLLGHYHGRALDLVGFDPDDRISVSKVALREWAYFSGSHVCPACLLENGGAWLLKWKLPWSFACVPHETLLEDACPRCERRTGASRQDGSSRPRFVARVPEPGRCANAQPPGVAAVGRAAIPCGYPLSEARAESLSRHPRLLEVQAIIDAALDGEDNSATGEASIGGEPVPALKYFRTLRSLCALLLYAARVEDLGALPRPVAERFGLHAQERNEKAEDRLQARQAGDDFRRGRRTRYFVGVPKSARLVAAILPTAVEALALPALLGGPDDGLARIFVRARERDPRALDVLPTAFSFPQPLALAYERWRLPQRRFSKRLVGDDTPSSQTPRAASLPLTHDHVPQLLWEADYEELFAELLSGVGADHARRVCSMALVRLTGHHAWKEAAELLGLPGERSRGMANRVVSLLNRSGNADLFRARLRGLADRLAAGEVANRVDYGRRRRDLADFVEIGREDWKGICGAAGVPPGKRGGKSRYATAWVWSFLTEGDYRFSPGFKEKDGESEREMYRRFVKNDLRALREPLADHGRGRLREMGDLA